MSANGSATSLAAIPPIAKGAAVAWRDGGYVTRGVVLICDDDPMVADVNAAILDLAGYTVHQAAPDLDPVTFAAVHQPDAILWGLHPRTNDETIAAIRRIGAYPTTRRTPVLLVNFTAHPAAGELPANVRAIVYVPYEPALLEQTVGDAIRAAAPTPPIG